MAIEDIRNFVPVSDNLATGGQPTEQQILDVARAGFAVVVNLGLLDPRYCLADEAGLVRSLGLAYHHIPVNFKAPHASDLEKFFDVMEGPAARGCSSTARRTIVYRASSPCTDRRGWDGPPTRRTRTSSAYGLSTTPGRRSSSRHGEQSPRGGS